MDSIGWIQKNQGMNLLSMTNRPYVLSDERSLKRAIDELSPLEPAQALAEAARWMESLLGNSGLAPAVRLRTLFALDQAVHRQARACIELYLSALAVGSPARNSLWKCAHSHWALVFDAYGESLVAVAAQGVETDTDLLAELSMRAIRAGAQCAKWDAFRHGPITESVWARLNLAYRLASSRGVARRNLRLRAERATETTVEREYLRAFALHSLGVDQLDAYRLELASRLIQYVLPYLELTEAPDAASLHWIDASGTLPPARLVKNPSNAGLPRFFSGIVAAQPLQDMLEMVIAGEVPAPLVSVGEAASGGSTGKVASVLSHMIRCWSNEPPVRRHRRHAMPGRMLVVEGLLQFARRLAGEPGAAEPRTWQMQDASLHGVGAEAMLEDNNELAVGTLVGMHLPDGNCWRVGAVRRLWRSSSKIGRIGVELLGGTPAAASVDDGSAKVSVIALDPLRRGQPVRVLVPVPGPRSGVPIYLLGGTVPIKLSPLTTLEYGADHEIRMYLYAG
ncbi:MAG: hypothetical protein JWL63_1205 [Rhodocyclales bacterium]|nr:hypothetical protein [Rhodocyclales bacterium]